MNAGLLEKGLIVEQIEWAGLPGERPREAGRNARLDVHGKKAVARVARITIGGITGFGWSRISKERAEEIVGTPVQKLFTESGTVASEFEVLEFPLLDWLGQVTGKPVYQMLQDSKGTSKPDILRVPCYDTTLYFDDLHLQDQSAAIHLMQSEAQEGKERGQRHFKMKVGRGGRWMPNKEGLERDIALIKAIREIAGPEGKLMIDANNGYNLNMTKEVLAATADCKLYWVEEAFHEDRVLYEDLKEWMAREQLAVMIADGEGLASPQLMEWAEKGVVDVIQYDIMSPGFCAWLEIGKKLDAWGAKSAPHSYGNVFGNYYTGHLTAAIKGFQFVECDPVHVEGLDATVYLIEDGFVQLPQTPGFGLHLDDRYFTGQRAESGWMVRYNTLAEPMTAEFTSRQKD
ncbi:MAG: enolase superfamily enzyme related to L-alanine-DL-glutamate epimerase [Paenibacillus sp.]|jgi:L-alanine-DL-glutamate epimerase-like enolase superfamily enzyme|nr:enolase superfamily enzyme related to L-alanine-DL-glutamate epimerase [Paenibacillus sp.]